MLYDIAADDFNMIFTETTGIVIERDMPQTFHVQLSFF